MYINGGKAGHVESSITVSKPPPLVPLFPFAPLWPYTIVAGPHESLHNVSFSATYTGANPYPLKPSYPCSS